MADIDPYAAPQADLDALPFMARRIGNDLVISHGAKLPPICLKCGTRSSVDLHHETFAWVAPMFAFMAVSGSLNAAFLYFATRQSARLDVYYCRRCAASGRTAQLAFRLAMLWSLVAFFLMESFAGSSVTIALFVSMFAAPLLIAYLFVRPRVVSARGINRTSIRLRGVAPAAIDEILAANA